MVVFAGLQLWTISVGVPIVYHMYQLKYRVFLNKSKFLFLLERMVCFKFATNKKKHFVYI